MGNLIQKFRQSSIVFEKPDILSENLKTLTSSIYPRVQYFLLKRRIRFLLTHVQKGWWVFFYFLQILIYLQKSKRPGFYTIPFYVFSNNSRSKQNKKYPEHPSMDIVKLKTCTKFILYSYTYTKLKLCGIWSSSKFSVFQTNNLVSRK